MRAAHSIVPLALCLAGLAGCTTQQVYGGGQGWQRNECLRLPDVQERQRCMASTQTSYDDYQRQKNSATSK